MAAEGRTIHDDGKVLPDDRPGKVVEPIVRFAVKRDRNHDGVKTGPSEARIQFQEKIDKLPFALCAKKKIVSKAAPTP